MNGSELDWYLDDEFFESANNWPGPNKRQRLNMQDRRFVSPEVISRDVDGTILFKWNLILLHDTTTDQMSIAIKFSSINSISFVKFDCKISLQNKSKEFDNHSLKDLIMDDNESKIWDDFSSFEDLNDGVHYCAYSESSMIIIKCKLLIPAEVKFKSLMMQQLEPFVNNPEFSDVDLEVDGKLIKAHKLILAARSPVFKAMFGNEMIENTMGKVHITDLSHEVFSEMLVYIYTDQTPNLEKLAYELLPAAEKYQIVDLKERCEIKLISALTLDNALQMLILSDLYRATNLKSTVLQFIKRNSKEVKNQSEDFKSLKSYPDLLVEILCVLS